MGSRKFLGGLTAAAVSLAVAISGCGAAGPAAPSSLDPAKLAPAGSLLYASITVRPQGPQRTEVEAALHKLFGKSADGVIQRQADKLLRRAGTSYNGGVQKWLGQRIGVVITGLSSHGVDRNDVALIAPTSDVSDARGFVRHALRKSPDMSGGIIGSYAVLGGQAAFRAIGAVAAGGQSLASSPAYQSDSAELSSAEMLLYVNLHRSLALIRALPQASVFESLLGKSISVSADAAEVLGLTLNAHQISLDLVKSGVKTVSRAAPASVAGLPASSWLAVAGGGALAKLSGKQLKTYFQGVLGSALSQAGPSASGAAALIEQRLGFIENTVLPALGPLSLSIAGTSPLALQAGLQMSPRDPAAAGRLLGMLRGLAAKSPALQVSGSATNFSVRVPTGTTLNATEKGGQVVVTYGFPDAAAFLHPSSTLASNPVFQRAAAQLPAGSSVPVFFEFAPVTALVQLTDHSPSAAKTLRTLRQLSYFIAGGHAGHERLVLGLN